MATIEQRQEDGTYSVGVHQPKIEIKTECDLGKAFKRLFKEETLSIVMAIYKSGPMTPLEIRKITNLAEDALNRDLIDMKNNGLIRKVEGRYYLTKYGAVLLEASEGIRAALKNIGEDKLFSVHKNIS